MTHVRTTPSRMAMTSSVRFEARMNGSDRELEQRPLAEPLRCGWWNESMRDKPVTLTSAFSAAALFLLGRVWG